MTKRKHRKGQKSALSHKELEGLDRLGEDQKRKGWIQLKTPAEIYRLLTIPRLSKKKYVGLAQLFVLLWVAVTIGLLAAGCVPETLMSDWVRVEPRVAAPGFTLPTLDGGSVALSDYRGKIVLLEFWATWCGPCRMSMPSLEAVYRKYRDQGVVALFINVEEPADHVRRWAGRRFTAPILLDEDGRVAQRYGVEGIPRLFVIDQDGRLAYAHEGYGGGLEHSLSMVIQELTGGSTDPGRAMHGP